MTNRGCAKLKARASSRLLPANTLRRLCVFYRNAAVAVCAVVGAMYGSGAPAADGGWTYQPYRVRALVAIDAPGGAAEDLSRCLPQYLQQRADAAATPLWQFDANLATGPLRSAILHSLREAVELPLSNELTAGREKLVLLGIAWTPSGFTVAAREYDVYLQRWGGTARRECRQRSALAEVAFELLCTVFAPVAQLEVDPADAKRVRLTPRGAALPPNAEGRPWCRPGDVFLPLVRRTARNGELEKNGVLPVAWTYIEAIEGKDKSLGFEVRSGSRRPFAARRQARVEQLAIAVPPSDAPTTLQLHVRNNEQRALVGYQVLAEMGGQDATELLGVSDAAGKVIVPAGSRRIEMLQIKHGSQLLARLPVVCGAWPRVAVPLPDDDARLAAEVRLAAVREDLIDVVARRNILMARVRQKIAKKDYRAADELLRALDDLPGNPQFNLTLANEARGIRSDDPQVQRRIDQLFKATQMLTTKFLDLRPINQIHDELRAARQKTPGEPKS